LIPKEVYVEIQLLKKHGFSLRQIAAEVGCAVNTVRRHLALEAVPKYERRVKRETKLGPYETYLRERQTAAHPDLDSSERSIPGDCGARLSRRPEPVARVHAHGAAGATR
jgi:transposase